MSMFILVSGISIMFILLAIIVLFWLWALLSNSIDRLKLENENLKHRVHKIEQYDRNELKRQLN